MSKSATLVQRFWMRASHRVLPFADVATPDLPLGRLVRLSLFQVSVGIVNVLLIGTLNRVMIVELSVAASLVAVMLALPLVVAPFRALIGFRSDHHRSAFGWRRVPYLWLGTVLQFGGLAMMPFAVLLLGEGAINGPAWAGHVGAALAFLMVGAGVQMTQTAGLALATDLAAPESRPRVVALMYVMLLVGMVAAGLVFGLLLADYTPLRLIQVIQGAASVVLVLNAIALWKQEPRNTERAAARGAQAETPDFRTAWRAFVSRPGAKRYLFGLGIGTAAFNMQDAILEPYGGEVLGLGVGETTVLTALLATGALCAFGLAARLLARGHEPHGLSLRALLVGLAAFTLVILSGPLGMPMLFRAGTALIGFAGGLFAVATLVAAMALERDGQSGLALGAWGAVQATSAGLAIALGGILRDVVGHFGTALAHPGTGYMAVYHLELMLLFLALAVIGPLVSWRRREADKSPAFGLAELPS
jgi:MFS transporter, BCD family, chlorophyll transporter